MREEVLYLYIHKSYGALYCIRFLDILAFYGVGPRALRLLWRCWDRLLMVARASGYFGVPFQVQRGIIQGGPLSPNIFNVVVDAVLRHWISVVSEVEGKAFLEGFGRDVHNMEA